MEELKKELHHHVAQCEMNFKRIDDRIDRLIESQERCTQALERLANETSGVIQLYRTAQSAVSLGIGAQKFGLWLVKWPIIGTGLYTIYNWLTMYLIK